MGEMVREKDKVHKERREGEGGRREIQESWRGDKKEWKGCGGHTECSIFHFSFTP